MIIICVCNFAWKGRPRDDVYCVGWDVELFSITHFTPIRNLDMFYNLAGLIFQPILLRHCTCCTLDV